MHEVRSQIVTAMTLIRGRGLGIELALAGRALDEALAELEDRLNERPGFYKGSAATAAFGSTLPDAEQLVALRRILDGSGIALTSLSGDAELEAVAIAENLAFVPVDTHQELARRRALRPRRELKLSDAARSLVADFAGARADIASRRKRGETSVPPVKGRAAAARPEPPVLHVVETAPGTLYHVGTLRGGQSLQHLGNIIVVGDVNPGAELVATGDILVFGRMAGVAHAGAQGDERARVYALHLDATQLRIATFIAADEGNRPRSTQPEAALVRDGRIVIAPYEKLDQFATVVGSTRERT